MPFFIAFGHDVQKRKGELGGIITLAVCATLAEHTQMEMQVGGTYAEGSNAEKIALVIKNAKLDANVLKVTMRMYLKYNRYKHRKTILNNISVKKIVSRGVLYVEVTDGDIKFFE